MMIFEPLIQNIVLLSIFYIIGSIYNFFVPVENPKPFKSVFYKLLHGAIFSVIITAVIYTHFNTVMLGLLIPLTALILIRKDIATKKFYYGNFFNKEEFFPLFCALIAASAILGYRSLFTNEMYGFVIQNNYDSIFYSKVTDYLWQEGIETISLEYFSKAGATPYHYFELWINVILRVVFGRNDSSIIISVTYTSLLTISFIGFASLAEYWGKSYILLIAAFTFLFLGGMYLEFYGNTHYLQYSGVLSYSVLNYPKLSVVLILLIYSTHYTLNQRNNEALIALLFLPIAYFTTTPAVFAAIGCVLLFQLVKMTQMAGDNLRNLVATYFFVLLFMVIFYYMNINKDTDLAGSTIIIIKEYLGELSYYRTIANIIIGTSVQVVILYVSIFMGLLVLYRVIIISIKKRNTNLLFVISVIILLNLFGLLGWGLLHFSVTTVQFFSNLTIPLLVLILFLIFIHLFYNISRLKAGVLVLVLIISQNIISFVREVRINYDEAHKPLFSISQEFIHNFYVSISGLRHYGAFYRSYESYKNIGLHNLVESTASLDLILHTYNYDKPFHTVSLTAIYIDSDSYGFRRKIVENMKNSSPIFRYIHKLKEQEKFVSIEESQLNFCLEHGIEYILVEGSAKLPEVFYDWFELKTTDEISKMQLYVIKEI